MFNTFHDLEAIIITCQVYLSDEVNTHVVLKLNIIASFLLGELWIQQAIITRFLQPYCSNFLSDTYFSFPVTRSTRSPVAAPPVGSAALGCTGDVAASLVLPRFSHPPENLAASFLPLPPERKEIINKESVHKCQGCMELKELATWKMSRTKEDNFWNRRWMVARGAEEKDLGMAGMVVVCWQYLLHGGVQGKPATAKALQEVCGKEGSGLQNYLNS